MTAAMPAAVRAAPRRMLVLDGATDTIAHRALADLPAFIRPGDVVVLNDAATLPASLPASFGDAPLELRLAVRAGPGAWWCALLGAGDWTVDTDQRGPVPPLRPGDRLIVGDATVTVLRRRPGTDHLALIRLADDDAGAASLLYQRGRPVRYRYLDRPLALAEVQTAWAGPPWAVEVPSAGLGLDHAALAALRSAGAVLVTVTHAAGLSATGDPALDASLPLPEPYDVPATTADAVNACRARGGRVLAIGTSATRALEAAAPDGLVLAGPGRATLRLGPARRPRVVDAVLTNMHAPGESHAALLSAFVPPDLVRRGWEAAAAAGYRAHELGDVTLSGAQIV
jgi:S-adenosylmethionine:tRNA ribosyltransferase-isomerase